MRKKPESKLDELNATALNALGESVRGLLDKQAAENKESVNALAFKAVAHVLQPFPQHAQEAVLRVFAGRLVNAERIGLDKAMRRHGGRRDEDCEMPTVFDLFGFEKRPDGTPTTLN